MIIASSSPGQAGHGRADEDQGDGTAAAVLERRAPRDIDTGTGDESCDALSVIRRPPPDLPLARKDVPELLDGLKVAGAAHHAGWHGRMDHVAARPIRKEADVSPQ